MGSEFGEQDERTISRIDNSAFAMSQQNACGGLVSSPHTSMPPGAMMMHQQQSLLPPHCNSGMYRPMSLGGPIPHSQPQIGGEHCMTDN